MDVREKTTAGTLAEDPASYMLNPSERFAETYRIHSQRRLAVAECPWRIVDLAVGSLGTLAGRQV